LKLLNFVQEKCQAESMENLPAATAKPVAAKHYEPEASQ
jgi:hypothetical protein